MAQVGMKDRFTHGFVSGLIAGFVPLAINWGTQALGLNTVVWVDFMGVFILGRGPQDFAEILFMLAIQFGLFGILGAVFALIIPHISSKRHLFKGAVYGVAVWFVLFSLPIVLQIGHLEVFPLKSAIVNFVSALFWGITLAAILKWIDNRVTLN